MQPKSGSALLHFAVIFVPVFRAVLHTDARLIVNQKSFLPQQFVQQTFAEKWLCNIQDVVAFWLGKANLLTQNTSGSTGVPKPVLLPKKVLQHSAQTTIQVFNLPPKSTALLVLPAEFIGGKMMVFRTLIGGWHLHVRQPKTVLQAVNRHFDFVALTPMQLQNSLPVANFFSKILLGGGPVSPTLADAVQASKAAVFHGYGMTETASHVALRSINGEKKSAVYTAVPGVQFVTDARDCLVIDAPKWGVEKMATNDVVQLHSASSFTWLGRADHVINSGGVKVFPEELERELANVITDKPFYISHVPDEKLGQKIVLVVAADKTYKPDFSALPGAKKPRLVIYVSELPRTKNGKILRIPASELSQKS